MRAPQTTAILALFALAGSGCFPELPLGMPGRRDYQLVAEVEVPGAVFNAAALNTRLEHAGLSIDTKLGARKRLSRTWNSATGAWIASWESRYDGALFVDPQGARFDTSSLATGAAIPGSHWVVVDADTVQTRGGLVFDFDAAGRIASEHWSFAAFPQLAYGWSADELVIEECVTAAQQQTGQCRRVARVRYGADGPTEVIDEVSAAAGAPRRVRYAYDAEGRLREAWTARQDAWDLPGTRYAYDGAGRLAAQTLPDGERIEYVYAQTHLLEVRQRGEGDPVHRFDYARRADGGWDVVHVAPLGGRTLYRVTSAGELVRSERLDLSVPESTTLEWHAGRLRPSRIRYPDGTRREFPTWVDDEPTEIVEASGNRVQITYAPAAVNFARPTRRAIASVVDDLGPVLSIAYDAAGLPESRRNGEGEITRFAYQGANLVRVIAPWGATVDFLGFGAAGHWLDAELSSVPDVRIHRAFDPVGNVVVPAAGARTGGVVGQDHDRDRRLRALEVAASDDVGDVTPEASVELLRGAGGRLEGIARPRAADHVMAYDALGRPRLRRERVDGAWQDTRFEHDLEGRLTALERPNGMREELDYDAHGRVTAHRALRHGVLEGEATFLWEGGRVVEVYDSLRGQSETYTYDAAGRPATITWSERGEVLVFEYDARSRTVREIYLFEGLARLIGSEWDRADRRVRRFTLDSGGAEQDLERRVHAEGRLVSVAYGNGLVRERLFDAGTGRFAGFRTIDPTGLEVEVTSFASRAAANPTRLEVSTRTRTALADTQEIYWLNAGGSLQTPEGRIGRRVFRWQGWRDGVLETEDAYAWDGLGNPLDDGDGDVFVYDAERTRLRSALTAGVAHTYAYDEAGFVTERDGLALEWTATGRLRRVGPAGDPLVEVAWDMAGRVVSVQALGQVRSFALFGGRVGYDAASGTPGELQSGPVSLPFTGAARRYRHFDALGNLSFASDETGAVLVHKRYRPFGVDAVYGGDDFTGGEARGFAGGVGLRHQGLETGLVVLGARILDSDVGRFLSQDPRLQLTSQYGYAEGNPVEKVDADGREALPKAASQELAAAFGGAAERLDGLSADAALAAGAFTFAGGVALLAGNGPVAGVFGAAAVSSTLVAGTAAYLAAAFRAAASAVEAHPALPPPSPADPTQEKELELKPATNWLTSTLSPAFGPIALPSPAGLSGGGGGGGCSPAAGVARPRAHGRRWLLSGLLLGLLLSLRVAAQLERGPAGDIA